MGLKKLCLTVAVTGIHCSDSPAPGLPVIRSLKKHPEWRGEVIGLAYDVLESGLFNSNLIDRAFILPYPSQGKERLLTRLEYIQKTSPIHCLIPNLDSELLGFVSISSELKELSINTFLPTTEQLSLRSKSALTAFGKGIDVAVPKTVPVFDPAVIPKVMGEIGFPVMVKGVFYEAYRAGTNEEVISYFYNLKAKWGLPVLLQEMVIGDEFNVVALGDGGGKVAGAVTMHKLTLTDKGKAWAGVTIKDKGIDDITDRVITELKWRGPLEIELLKSRRDGRFYILEINPRFPAWVYLATASGVNLPWMTVRLAMGERVKSKRRYTIGQVFVRSTEEFITNMKAVEILSTKGEIAYE